MRTIFRFGYSSTLWAPPVKMAGAGRFDDPRQEYRVLYVSSQRLGVFLERLAPFVNDPVVKEGLKDIGGPGEPLFDTLPASYLDNKRIGSGTLLGEYADVVSHVWIAELCLVFGRLDASVLQSGGTRSITQSVSRLVYERQSHAGIRYLSRLGHDIENWAVFEPFALVDTADTSIDPLDPDLQRVLELYSLKIADRSDPA